MLALTTARLTRGQTEKAFFLLEACIDNNVVISSYKIKPLPQPFPHPTLTLFPIFHYYHVFYIFRDFSFQEKKETKNKVKMYLEPEYPNMAPKLIIFFSLTLIYISNNKGVMLGA